MKKLILLTGIFILSITTANAQWWSNQKVVGNKEVVKQTRSVNEYDRIAVTGMMEVQLVAGKEGKIDLEAEGNLMEYIETEVSGGLLKIGIKKGVNLQPSKNYPIKLVVTFEDLDGLTLTGSGHIRNSDPITAREFKVSVTGSGNMNLDIKTDSFDGSLTGSGDVKLKGSTRDLKCKVTGSGDFLAFDFKAVNVTASVTGSGDIEVSVENELNANVSGSGDIKYKGDPTKESFKTSGSGKVTKK